METAEVLTREKAAITTDAIAASGKLNPQQANKFIDYVFDETMLKNNARTIKFNPEQLDIDKIGVGRRVAMPATEAVAPTHRRGVTTSKISLNPKEIIVPFEISDRFKEVNIEGENVEDHIIRMMAKSLGNNLEELYLLGDLLGMADYEDNIYSPGSTTSVIKDNYLAMFDGWMRKADGGNTVDIGGAAVGAGVFALAKRKMPTKFRKVIKDLRFFMSADLAQLYAEKLSTRATKLGDDALNMDAPPPVYGIPIVPVPLMPFYPKVVEHVTLGIAGAPIALRYKPIRSGTEIVTDQTLAEVPAVPYNTTTHYTMDYTNGTIAAKAPLATAAVKITYEAMPQALLTHMENFIVGIGRDIRIEKDRDIYKRTNQYAISAAISVQIEEASAIVKAYNIGDTI
jgi:hypothetical protein